MGLIISAFRKPEKFKDLTFVTYLLTRLMLIQIIFAVLEGWLPVYKLIKQQPLSTVDTVNFVAALVTLFFTIEGVWAAQKHNIPGAFGILLYILLRQGFYVYQIVWLLENQPPNYIGPVVGNIVGFLFRIIYIWVDLRFISLVRQSRKPKLDDRSLLSEDVSDEKVGV